MVSILYCYTLARCNCSFIYRDSLEESQEKHFLFSTYHCVIHQNALQYTHFSTINQYKKILFAHIQILHIQKYVIILFKSVNDHL